MAAFNNLKKVLMLAFDWILYSAALQGHPEPTSKVEKRWRSPAEDKAPHRVHVHQYYYSLQTAVAAMEQFWCQSDTEAEVPFISVEAAGVADTCQVTVTQPRSQEADSSMHTVLLTCAFSSSGCSSSPPQILWFRFLTNKHEDLCTPVCRDHQKYRVHISSENNISLQINNLTVYDNAVYICGVAFSDSSSPHSKQTGSGTVLTKTGAEKQQSNGKFAFIFMTIISSLLFLYSTTVFTFFVVYKLKPKLLKKSGNEDSRTEDCKIRSGRQIFQAIAQELRKQRYAENWQQPDEVEDDTVYQNR